MMIPLGQGKYGDKHFITAARKDPWKQEENLCGTKIAEDYRKLSSAAASLKSEETH